MTSIEEPWAAPAAGRVPAAERRRSRRRPLPGVLVAIEAPARSDELCWAGSAVDINGDGLGLSLPPEVEPGAEVLLTFRLSPETTLARVPGVVVRQDEVIGFGAVRFRPWPEIERLELLEYLLAN